MRKDFVRLGEHPWKTISGMQEKEFLFSIDTCVDPGIFVRGGPGQSDKKSSDNVFFFFFLVLSLFHRSQMVNFKENYRFSCSGGGPTYSRGVQLFSGGVQLLIPYRNPYNL